MDKFKVYVTRRIPDVGLEKLQKECEISIWEQDEPVPKSELLKNISDVDGLLCLLTDDIDQEVIDQAGPKLKVISTMSVGYEHIDIESCKARGIAVSNTGTVSTESVAELTVTLLLMTARRVVEGVNAVKNGEWDKWKPMWLCGTEMTDKTMGVLGFGKIGYGVAKRMKSFGISRLIYNDVCKLDYAEQLEAEFVDFDTLLQESDIICICCNLTPETKHKFNKTAFERMKNRAILINSGRGGVIEHDDLYDALTSGQIAAAGLDVTEPEPLPSSHRLLGLSNCIILPHMGSNTWESRNEMAGVAADNMLAVLHGKKAASEILPLGKN